KVPEKHKEQFAQIKTICSSDRGYCNLRRLVRAAELPAVLPLEISLQELIFIGKSTEKVGDREILNVSLSLRLLERVKNIQMYQQYPYTDIQENGAVQRMLLEEFSKLKEITEEQIWDMSTEVKCADERDKTRIC
ncbi:hypothetical protein RFI_30205, partial [Reticulomyxa filosa]